MISSRRRSTNPRITRSAESADPFVERVLGYAEEVHKVAQGKATPRKLPVRLLGEAVRACMLATG